MENLAHPQETFLETFSYQGVGAEAAVELVRWAPTRWCGRLGFAAAPGEEPDVEKIMAGYQALNWPAAALPEKDWSVCLSIGYCSDTEKRGVLFGSLADEGTQLDGADFYEAPAALYLKIRLCDETAAALGESPWQGGVPPYHWVEGKIGPALGYRVTSGAPIVEYYGFWEPEAHIHRYCYLYVPVEKQAF